MLKVWITVGFMLWVFSLLNLAFIWATTLTTNIWQQAVILLTLCLIDAIALVTLMSDNKRA